MNQKTYLPLKDTMSKEGQKSNIQDAECSGLWEPQGEPYAMHGGNPGRHPGGGVFKGRFSWTGFSPSNACYLIPLGLGMLFNGRE